MDTFALGENKIKERYTFAEDTIKELERIGVVSMPKPKMQKAHETIFPDLKAGQYYDGRMPMTMKQLSLDEVSMLLSLTSNWYGYLAAQYTIVTARRSEAKRKRDAVLSITRNTYRKILRHWGQTASDPRCMDLARQDSRFVEAEDTYERLNVVHDALYTFVEHTKKELDVVSREVTIRQTKMESDARQRGIHNRVVGDPRRARVPTEERRQVNDSTAGDGTPRKVTSKFGQGKIRPPKQ